MVYGDEYLAAIDHIEVIEKAKDGYESDVPELKDKTYEDRYPFFSMCVSLKEYNSSGFCFC